MSFKTLEMIFKALETGFEAGFKRVMADLKQVRPVGLEVLERSGMDLCELCEDQKG
jgi:hypothetical protein